MGLQFSVDEIIKMQEIIKERIGGGAGVLDMNMLESSAGAPFVDYFGEERYPGVMDKAARYATAFDKKQVFVDGNKRVSVSTMLGWLARNGYKCTLSAFQLHELMMDLANNSIEDEKDLASILESHTVKTDEFEGKDLTEIMDLLLASYEETYVMLGKGPDDESIEIWKQAKRKIGDDGDYRAV